MPKRHFFDIIKDPAEKKKAKTPANQRVSRCRFFVLKKRLFEANNFEADFVMVGTNVLRVDRGKPPVGSVPA